MKGGRTGSFFVSLVLAFGAVAANAQLTPPPLPPMPPIPGGGGQKAASTTGIPLPGDSGDPSGTNGGPVDVFPPYTFPTNGLWLQIFAPTNEIVPLILHGTEENKVYGLVSRTDLNLTNWFVEQMLHGTSNETSIATSVPFWGRTNLFLWASDWTDADVNANGLPDWWEWEQFGNFDQSGDADYDGDGVSNLAEYQNGTDPNKIQFSIEVTNKYVNASTLVDINVSQGVPSSFAALVDNTNQAQASWTAYSSSNLLVNLGSQEGWHDVRIGLRGRLPTSQQTWVLKRLKLDTIPPQLVITSPTTNTVGVGLIQLQGYSPEPLASLTYDVSNAGGILSNQTAMIVKTIYNTNTAELTTNFFQCYDVTLAEGLNTITLRAEDWAGNVSTAVANITFCAPTNPPSVQLLWPQDGMKISGETVILKGRVDDPTATVTATAIGSDGTTNSFSGLTGRDGIFWIQNVPLGAGTNAFTLTATGASGQSALDFGLVKSALILTIDPVQPGQSIVRNN